MIKSYKDLIVWQKAIELALLIFQTTCNFPPEEKFALGVQTRKAAYSIPSNIAEGSSRNKRREYIQFLRISFASGAELETQLIISYKTGLVSTKDFQSITSILNEIMRILNSLIRKVKSSNK